MPVNDYTTILAGNERQILLIFLDECLFAEYNELVSADDGSGRDPKGTFPDRDAEGAENSQAKGSDLDAPWKAAMHRRSKAAAAAESFR